LEALSQSQHREQLTLAAPIPVFDAIRVGLSPRSWIKKIEISGERVTIEGNAISERDVLETLARLQGASIFSDVRVDSTRLVRRDELYTHEFIFRAKHGYETVLGKIP
jgi:Tfp pilus assembly protein PilN